MARRNSAAAGESVDSITDALLTASRLLVALSARSLAHADESLTIPQFRTLMILSTRGPAKIATLAGLLNVQPSTATRMVDRLVTAGLIDRQPNPQSRRELIVGLTERGRDTVEAVTSRRRQEIAAVVERMPPADRSGLVSALNAFSAAGGELTAETHIEGYQL
ncbi:MarR family winged helix-turn-helix transcriptional regulator [Nocardia inohanensis]|uniref:MarR family winged helix-turn-helix transcriptional regulator n=1 Tax=Nocardia inohanensis TaxID=209246 RepID=UPI00083584AB|nr:MarR family transcriptional regulator [Nocardia inohanensis]